MELLRGNIDIFKSWVALSLMFQSEVPKHLWSEAFHKAVFVINRLPTSENPNGMSPYQMVTGQSPDYSILRAFGCICSYG